MAPLSPAAKLGVVAGLALLGLATWAAIWLILDGPPLRHSILHSIWRSKLCGRCIDETRAKKDDAAFDHAARVGRVGPVAREVRR